tara:strand:+ start:153 stop:803 length:651 start_codon:yes stop_codon:yes gene_type:complete
MNIIDNCSKILGENVSRETFERLEAFVHLHDKWNRTINLSRYQSYDELWTRHVLDGMSVIKYFPDDASVVTDFGSGGGFPGIVIAIMKDVKVHLVESDQRKVAFLHEASQFAKNTVVVHEERIEVLAKEPWQTDVLTARALAPLHELIPMILPFVQKTKICLFHQGQNGVKGYKEVSKETNLPMHLISGSIPEHSYIVRIQGGMNGNCQQHAGEFG